MVDRHRSARPGAGIGLPVVAGALLLLSAFLTGCGQAVATKAASCDGVSSDVGGCAADQPTFSGTTCAEVGAEWGEIVDERSLAVIQGPANADGKARSARLKDVQVLAFVRAADHMGEVGILGSCHSAEFVGAAEPKFTPELRASVGGAMYDGEPVVTYTEYLADVLQTARALDAP